MRNEFSLHDDGALGEPIVLGHLFDQDFFSAGAWFVLGYEVGYELEEFGFVLVGEQEEASGEVVLGVVGGGGGFSGFGFCSG